jgi:hypothetical protein
MSEPTRSPGGRLSKALRKGNSRPENDTTAQQRELGEQPPATAKNTCATDPSHSCLGNLEAVSAQIQSRSRFKEIANPINLRPTSESIRSLGGCPSLLDRFKHHCYVFDKVQLLSFFIASTILHSQPRTQPNASACEPQFAAGTYSKCSANYGSRDATCGLAWHTCSQVDAALQKLRGVDSQGKKFMMLV